MIAKKTVKNQITLPKRVVALFPDVEYFEVQVQDGQIVLKPVIPDRIERVRDKLASLGIEQKDIQEAIAWARKRDD
ncbi:MAG: AbrB/MazE/SpoVT family DNA-binding domain-containing protein [Deltaproteobacteria bacterium]|nr:AbrB/MazE/SpoVT family DNA-binding domain-containing protein [Deltaproteobacteria bacterium]